MEDKWAQQQAEKAEDEAQKQAEAEALTKKKRIALQVPTHACGLRACGWLACCACGALCQACACPGLTAAPPHCTHHCGPTPPPAPARSEGGSGGSQQAGEHRAGPCGPQVPAAAHQRRAGGHADAGAAAEAAGVR